MSYLDGLKQLVNLAEAGSLELRDNPSCPTLVGRAVFEKGRELGPCDIRIVAFDVVIGLMLGGGW